ncbi:anion transporter [Actinobacillus equuli]|nr:anion transporter [Actinobacillus equuli]
MLRPNFNVPFEVKVEQIPLTAQRLTTLVVFV